jgi:hypothetical protein
MAPRARLRDADEAGPAVVRVGLAGDQAVGLERVEDGDQPGLVVPDRRGERELGLGRPAGEVGEGDVAPHRQPVGVQQRPLGVDQPAGDAGEHRSQVLAHVPADRTR